MQSRTHSASWQWWVSCLLLLATMINYMDRQTLSNLSVRITQHFNMTNEQFGDMEMVFGLSFAFGSLFFGFIADFVSVRLLYPLVLVAWSLVGVATGLSQGYASMLVCRGLLGFFEAGHWPCALIVTQSVLASGSRLMGNSILQSGASIGAIITPIIISVIVASSEDPAVWRTPFLVIGGVGLLWVVLWFWAIRPGDLIRTAADPSEAAAPRVNWLLADRRFWALAIMVVSINTSWQLVRAWLPKFLQEGRGYSEAHALYFNSVYFGAADVGCILAGVVGLWLCRAGVSVHRSRVLVYLACALIAGLTSVAALLPAGWPLLAILLCVAAGTLGVFPCYYSFTQEVTTQYMGRLTGMLSFIGWAASAPTQKAFGYVVDQTGSYDINLAVLGWAPLVGLIGFLLLWPREKER